MKKKYYSFLVPLIILISCGDSGNYKKVSEMNNLHPIEIVYFDSQSAEEYGDFPINRNIYCDLIHEIEKDDPAFIILKFFFDTEKEEDLEFAETIKSYNNILTQATMNLDEVRRTPGSVLKKLSLRNTFYKTDHYNDQIVLPNKQLLNSFSGIGLVDFITEDGKYNNFNIMSEVNGYYFPSLALKTAMLVTGSEPEFIDGRIFISDKEITRSDGLLTLDLSKPKSFYNSYFLIDIINRKKGETDFNNKIVIVYIEDPSVRNIKSRYYTRHNNAEIVADSINTILKKIQ